MMRGATMHSHYPALLLAASNIFQASAPQTKRKCRAPFVRVSEQVVFMTDRDHSEKQSFALSDDFAVFLHLGEIEFGRELGVKPDTHESPVTHEAELRNGSAGQRTQVFSAQYDRRRECYHYAAV